MYAQVKWIYLFQPVESAMSTTRSIHYYDENLNDETKTVIKIAFYDKYFGFIIDHR